MQKQTTEPHHHSSHISKFVGGIRETIFGLGDGLVSTVGTITGIAGATYDSFIVILAGLVLVAVEALSMSVGEYLSSKSENEVWQKYIDEERKEITEEPERERQELEDFYREKGLSAQEVKSVSDIVAKHPAWVLEEMAVHELKLSPVPPESPLRGAFIMFFTYIIGGLVPLAPYFVVPVHQAFLPSIGATTTALFVIGALKARFTTGKWLRGGLEMTILSLIAASIGLIVGRMVVAFV